MNQPRIILVSACLVGLYTRYDGRAESNEGCMNELAGACWIPVCPEQLGGLTTPRQAADLVGGDGHDVLDGRARVLRKDGTDVTGEFIRGAQQVLSIASSQTIAGIFTKARSPSCGLTPPLTGVTAALLLRHGFPVREF